MSISHCFEGRTAVVELESADKHDAFRELIRKAPVFLEVADRTRLESAVIEREKDQCTALGHGVAVAHGRLETIPRVVVALGISRAGISYGSPDGSSVHMLFLIASPPRLYLDYLQALSALVRVVHDPRLRGELLSLPSCREVELRIRAAFLRILGRTASETASVAASETASVAASGTASVAASGTAPVATR
jgi:nitrogen PTS system EIIA component